MVANKPNSENATLFSLFYFAASSADIHDNPYSLYLESAKFADLKGFKAIWTPERHFHEVGGQYPNPAVLSAGLATVTNQIELRAGSVVLPLHNPLRVAEEWSIIDNLSQDRVGIAFASGWNPKDFTFFPENYQDRKEIMLHYIEKVRTLWRGGTIKVVDGLNTECQVGIFPKPKQSDLPIWITAAGGKETFIEAGKIGANILTHLLGQNIETVAEKISLYRNTLKAYGYHPQQYVVTLMLHTFVSNTTESALRISKQPFCDYLKSHISLENMAKSLGKSSVIESQSDTDDIIEAAFDRYAKTASLIGSVEDCLKIVSQLKRNGVDEIACLIDFGINKSQVLEGLAYLALLKERSSHIINLDYSKITNYLKNYLPEYMLPSGFVIHEKLPLTHNGKIDRKQLAQQSTNILKSALPIIHPRTAVELLIAKIWQEVLGIEIKSIYDNFFTLGGHSLLATQAILKVRRTFKIDVPLNNLFSNPTVVQFAKVMEELEKIDKPYKEETAHAFMSIQQQGYKPPLFLIYPGCGMPFAYLPLADHITERPIYAFINPRFYELNNKFAHIEEMAAYYCKVIKDAGYEEPYSIGGWSFGGVVAYEMASIFKRENILVETVIMIDSFNLSRIKYKPCTEDDILYNLKALNIDPERADAKYFKSEFIHNEKLLMNYKPSPYYGKVALLKAQNPTSAQDYMHKLPYNGWRVSKNMQFTKIIIPGDHNQFFSSIYIKDLVKAIESILDNK